MNPKRKVTFEAYTFKNKQELQALHKELGVTDEMLAEADRKVAESRTHPDRKSLPQLLLFLLRANVQLAVRWLRARFRRR
ncbi:MAG: hypothetical protein GFH27_549289n317 [Chloroflexi bacterium AL-W]|nr:hypothetical protein [Chloroflexi bacterium AL-N1]NOK67049.1 hypothetical protein [Chloroflexi bacterium AL-N10]NOK74659.1 hypothetical protein [Chloroflexi bacterium AL-N5]NOK81651.1 hypothetical protein [Chloroflexi bacterium AL-W]NOK89121.1 hypothetical protein [Chloroflexi bacterium AL-N15]